MWIYTSRIWESFEKPNFEMLYLSKIDEVSTDYNACNEMNFHARPPPISDHLPYSSSFSKTTTSHDFSTSLVSDRLTHG